MLFVYTPCDMTRVGVQYCWFLLCPIIFTIILFQPQWRIFQYIPSLEYQTAFLFWLYRWQGTYIEMEKYNASNRIKWNIPGNKSCNLLCLFALFKLTAAKQCCKNQLILPTTLVPEMTIGQTWLTYLDSSIMFMWTNSTCTN